MPSNTKRMFHPLDISPSLSCSLSEYYCIASLLLGRNLLRWGGGSRYSTSTRTEFREYILCGTTVVQPYHIHTLKSKGWKEWNDIELCLKYVSDVHADLLLRTHTHLEHSYLTGKIFSKMWILLCGKCF